MRPVWFIVAFIFLIMPVFGFYNVYVNGYNEDRWEAHAAIWGMTIGGVICIILGIVQKSGVYVTGTMIRKQTDETLPKGYTSSSTPAYQKNIVTQTNPTLPKGFTPSSGQFSDANSKHDPKNWNTFLNPYEKTWNIGAKQFVFKENIPEDKMQEILEMLDIPNKVERGELDYTQEEADVLDEKIRETLYQAYFDVSLETIRSLLGSEEGKLFGELMIFITQLKTLENAKNSPYYDERFRGQNVLEMNKDGTVTEFDLENNFQRFSWENAEDLVGKLFEKKGYVVTVGIEGPNGIRKRQGDFGIDVEAKNASEYLGIQVKHWNNDVGFEDVAKTLGVSQKYNKVIIVSTKSGFTLQAQNHAADNHYLIELWDSNRFKQELKQHVLGK